MEAEDEVVEDEELLETVTIVAHVLDSVVLILKFPNWKLTVQLLMSTEEQRSSRCQCSYSSNLGDGSCNLLQSDNGGEFTADISNQLAKEFGCCGYLSDWINY